MKNILTLFVVFIIGLLMMFWFSNGIHHARTDRKVIALTFDDGPNPPYTEQLLRSLEEKQVKASFFLIGKQVGMTNLSFFRPPGGFLFPWQNSMLEKHGLKHISADVMVGDWKDADVDTICTRVVRKVRPGSVIVLHDGGGERPATIESVPLIIDELRARGYSFLTAGELLLP